MRKYLEALIFMIVFGPILAVIMVVILFVASAVSLADMPPSAFVAMGALGFVSSYVVYLAIKAGEKPTGSK